VSATRFLDACARKPVDATPVWFMRQAGRSLDAYDRLRERHSIMEIAKTPELNAEVSALPVDVFGVDAAVMFADIMFVVEAMGVPLELDVTRGVTIHDPVRTMADVERLRVVDPREGVPFILEAIRQTRERVGDRAAVIGFCGGPFTLAGYLLEGSPTKFYHRTKQVMFGQPELWHALATRLVDQQIPYLQAQVEAGAQALQVFDSWMGALAPADYEALVLPHTRRLFDAANRLGVPTIHFGTGNAPLLPAVASVGCDVVSVDWRVPLDDAWATIGHDVAIQGNLDGGRLLGGWAPTEAGMRDVLRRATVEGVPGGTPRDGHIFNLGHGIAVGTDADVLRRLVAAVHEETAR
jgi:uroporphyrinogen decarboxylase